MYAKRRAGRSSEAVDDPDNPHSIRLWRPYTRVRRQSPVSPGSAAFGPLSLHFGTTFSELDIACHGMVSYSCQAAAIEVARRERPIDN